MKYLLDTHAAVWNMERDPRLPPHIRRLIDESATGDCVIAEASLVEIARLFHSGKVSFTGNPITLLEKLCEGLKPLPVTPTIAWRAVAFDWAHRDPADRLICSTAIEYSLPLITRDRVITEWGGVPVLW